MGALEYYINKVEKTPSPWRQGEGKKKRIWYLNVRLAYTERRT